MLAALVVHILWVFPRWRKQMRDSANAAIVARLITAQKKRAYLMSLYTKDISDRRTWWSQYQQYQEAVRKEEEAKRKADIARKLADIAKKAVQAIKKAIVGAFNKVKNAFSKIKNVFKKPEKKIQLTGVAPKPGTSLTQILKDRQKVSSTVSSIFKKKK